MSKGLAGIADPAADNFLIGDGESYVAQAPAEALESLGLSPESTPAFAGLTLTGALSGTTATFSGLITAAGGQIAFPATQDPSADPNTLDDYEEGNWTPTAQDNSLSNSESQTYTSQVGTYQKVGNRVHIQGTLTTASLGTLTTTQGLKIAGLPFAASGGNGGVTVTRGQGLAITAGQNVVGFIANGDTYITMQLWDATTGTTDFLLSEHSADGDLRFHGSYTV